MFSGQWNIYRRKEDASMWEKFELLCIDQQRPPSEMLARLVRAHLDKQK